ncbi:MAG TPA: hypothetical protein VFE33_19285 [Thermoanaerobaculia bacterium]|nr:hypothetical protein [Thermoanaerobaculia bacterium]
MGAPPPEDVELIPELPLWNEGSGISMKDWIACVGSFEHAIGYSRLFWPEFVEREGCIVWPGADAPLLQHWKEHLHGDLQKVERVVNHRHIADLFADPDLDPTRAQLRYLGRVLREIWQVKLDHDFPDRHVRVVFNDTEEDIDLLDYQITFFQDPPAPAP